MGITNCYKTTVFFTFIIIIIIIIIPLLGKFILKITNFDFWGCKPTL